MLPCRRWLYPLVFALCFVLVPLLPGTPHEGRWGRAYAVCVDGRSLGVVRAGQLPALEEFVDRLVQSWSRRAGRSVRLAQSLRLLARPFVAPQERSSSLASLLPVLRRSLTPVTPGAAIAVDGKSVVVVADRAAAGAMLEGIKRDYAARTEEQVRRERGRVVEFGFERLEIAQRVEVRDGMFRAGDVKPSDLATRILLRGTDKLVTHTVARGESLWSIASANHISVENLRQANPDLANPNLLHVGQKLSLVVPDPYLTIVSTEKVVYTQLVPYATQVVYDENLWPWERAVRQPGVFGEKLVTLKTEREDGKVKTTQVLSEVPVKAPTIQVVAQGNRPIPTRGTGRLAWPLVGPVTSPYGRRHWDFHRGVDIAAPVGTPVVAADSGIVTSSGYLGQYGQAVIIDHGGGKVVTLYGHLSGRLLGVGDKVDKGQVIGWVGNTGRSTGPHLHFEVRLEGKTVDPIDLFQRQAE